MIRGRKGKPGLPAGLRDVYILNRGEPSKDEEVGAEPTEEQPEVVEQPEEPEPVEETPEEPAEETPEEVPPSEAPLAEDAPTEEEAKEEEAPTEEVTEAPAEPEPVEEEVTEEEEEVTEEEPKVEAPKKPYMTLTPESPVTIVSGSVDVKGEIFGLSMGDTLYLTVEKSTSNENGWTGWGEFDIIKSPSGERTPASLTINLG